MTTQNKNLRKVFISAFCFVLILSFLSYSKISSLIESGELVNHTMHVSLALEKVVGGLQDAETGHRGYLLTHDKKFLESFNRSLAEYPENIKAVRQLTIDNPTQQKNLEIIASLAKYREDYMIKMLEVDKTRPTTVAELLTGKSIMDSLRFEVNNMIKAENTLMKQRSKELEKQMFMAPAMLLILSLLALTILIISYWQLNKSLLRAQRLKNDNLRFIVETEKQKELQNIFKQAPVAISVFRGKDFIVESINDIGLQTWGKTYEEVINKPFLEISPELRYATEPFFKTVMETGQGIISNELKLDFIRNGKPFVGYFNFIREPLRNIDGIVDGVISIGVEVTESVEARNAIEESKQLYEAIAQNTPDLMYVFDLNYRFTYANDALLEMWGRTWDDAIGKNMPEIGYEPWHAEMHEREIDQVVATKRSIRGEVSFPHATLGRRIYDYIFAPVIGHNGNVTAITGTTRDITQLVEARNKVEESEQNIRSMVLQSPIGICVIDATTLVSEIVNNSFIEIAGKSYEEISGKHYWDTFAEARPYYESALNKVIEKGEPFYANEVELMLIRHGKEEIIYVTFVYAPLKNIEGNVKKVAIWVLDNTQQVIARQKIADADKRFRNTVKQAPVGITILRGPEYTVEMANDAYLKLVDREEAGFVGNPLFDSLPEVKDVVSPLLDGVLSTGIPYHGNEVSIPVNRFGHTGLFYFDFLYAPLKEEDGKISGIIVTVTEVSEKVEARKKIEQNEQRLNIVVEASELGTWELNLKTNQATYSQRYLEILGGYKEDIKLTHAQLLQHLHPDDLGTREKAFKEALVTGYLNYQARLIWVDRSIHWMEGKGKVFYDKENNPLKLIGTLRDITEEKDHEQELRESEKRFRSLAQTLPQLVWVTDARGNPEFASFRWKEYSGIEPGDEIAWKAIVHPDDYENINAAWVHSLTTGSIYNFDVRLKNKNGEYRWHTVKGEPVLDKENKIIKWVGAFTDSHAEKTFTKELELQVQQRTKELEQKSNDLEKLNKELQSFAYISSHDLQEPLRKIQTFATRIAEKERDTLSEYGKDNFKRMQDAAKRMQTLIQDLLAYSRTNTAERQFENTDLAKIVDEVTEDLKEDLKDKHATIEATELCDAHIIPFQFRQLMHNLIGNALKFSNPSQPTHIKIKSEIANGTKFNNVKLSPQKKYCHISVSDNGIGFEPQYSEKIFEVFQRLHGKNEYEGTGIGLSIVKKIVDNHEGIIIARGELNKGAIFDIYIPAT